MSSHYKIVYIEWEDSSCTKGWNAGTEYESYIIRTIGYLISKSNQGIVVSSHISSVGNTSDAMHIPQSAIRKFKYVK